MLKINNIIVVLFFTIFVAACSSSPYQYHVNPTSIEKGKTLYYLGEIDVDLTWRQFKFGSTESGNGMRPNDDQFADEGEITQLFRKYFLAFLKDKKILAVSAESADAILDVQIDYERTFNLGGNSLHKPRVSFTVKVTKGDQLLASFGEYNFTTKYAYLKDSVVNLQIAAFQWGAEDEPKDINVISKVIVDDVYKLGK